MLSGFLTLNAQSILPQARGDLGSAPGGCRPFHFPLFSPHNIFISSTRQDALSIGHILFCQTGSVHLHHQSTVAKNPSKQHANPQAVIMSMNERQMIDLFGL